MNAADTKGVKDKASRQKVAEKQVGADIREVMATSAGRRMIWQMVSDCGVFSSSFTGDDARTNYLEGQRAVGLRIIDQVSRADPDGYGRMFCESIGLPTP